MRPQAGLPSEAAPLTENSASSAITPRRTTDPVHGGENLPSEGNFSSNAASSMESSPSSPLTPLDRNAENLPSNGSEPLSSEAKENPFDSLIPHPNEYFTDNEMTEAIPVSLHALLKESFQSQGRRERIHAYWDLVEAMAIEQLRRQEVQHLTSLLRQVESAGVGSSSPGANELRLLTARTTAAFREATLQTRRQQFRVRSLMGPQSTDKERSLPVPIDPPHIGSYSTNRDSIANSRGLSEEAALADQLLPLQLEAIRAHRQAVEVATYHFDALNSSSLSSGIEEMRKGIRSRIAAQVEWIQAVTEYNRTIGTYVSEVVGPEITGTRLIATLIPQPQRGPTPASRDPHRGTIESGHRSTSLPPSSHAGGRVGTLERTVRSSPAPMVETRPLRSELPKSISENTEVVPASALVPSSSPPPSPQGKFQPGSTSTDPRFSTESKVPHSPAPAPRTSPMESAPPPSPTPLP